MYLNQWEFRDIIKLKWSNLQSTKNLWHIFYSDLMNSYLYL
jgi:hypothetical protein